MNKDIFVFYLNTYYYFNIHRSFIFYFGNDKSLV